MRWIFFSLFLLNIAFASWQAFLWFDQNNKAVKSEAVADQSKDVSGIVLLDEDKDSARLKPKTVKQKQKPVIKDNGQSVFKVNESLDIQEVSATFVSASAEQLSGCPAFGPFESSREREKLIDYFEAQGIASSLFEQKSAGALLYWLYVQPQSSREAAQKLVVTLSELQIESILIDDGDLVNGLSLGLFNSNDEIEKLTARLYFLDVDVNKINKSEGYIEYWVVLEKQESGMVDETLLNELTNTFPGVRSSEKVCKPVAS